MISDNTIFDRFRQRALSQTDRPAILAPGVTSTTFGALLDFVESSRSKLHSLGVGRGSRLGILLVERAHTAAAHLLAASTCISVPLNPDMTANELRVMVRDMSIEALLVSDAIPDTLVTCAEDSVAITIRTHSNPGTAGLFEMEGRFAGKAIDESNPLPDDTAVLLQTSGTTAKPKIVPQTQLNRIVAGSMHSATLGIVPRDRCLNMMPTHHEGGLNAEFLSPILSGASVAFVDFEPGSLRSTVDQFLPTWFNLVPSMHQAVLERLDGRKNVFRNSSIRFARSTSAMLASTLRSRLGQAYGVPIVDSYGPTECAYIASTGQAGSEARPGSVGRPVHDGVVVANEEGNPLPAGERGEICVTGPAVISGYENNPQANAESFHDGWYRTGDEGYFDADGFLYVTGRLREIVNRGGEKFSLAELDEAILQLDGVAEGAAFVAPDAKLGHEVYAAVVLSSGSDVSPATLRSVLASSLSWSKVPKRIFVVEAIPMNSTGKVLRRELTDRLTGIQNRDAPF